MSVLRLWVSFDGTFYRPDAGAKVLTAAQASAAYLLVLEKPGLPVPARPYDPATVRVEIIHNDTSDGEQFSYLGLAPVSSGAVFPDRKDIRHDGWRVVINDEVVWEGDSSLRVEEVC